MSERIHKGLNAHRLRGDNPREVVFADHWEAVNTPRRNSSHGESLLQVILNGMDGPGISQRDIEVAATVVQWMGSPVGFGWLERALEDCGYKLLARK